jgi:hypothetical protein
MQFFVYCKHPSHPQLKVYVRFEKEPQTKSEIPFWTFQMTCIEGHTYIYSKGDVHAEVGLEPIGGAILGGLLVFLDPIVGVLGAAGGYAAVLEAERTKVRKFEESQVA